MHQNHQLITILPNSVAIHAPFFYLMKRRLSKVLVSTLQEIKFDLSIIFSGILYKQELERKKSNNRRRKEKREAGKEMVERLRNCLK